MKAFYNSLTMWSAAVLAFLKTAEGSGVVPEGLGELVANLLEWLAMLGVVAGRWRAKGPLSLG